MQGTCRNFQAEKKILRPKVIQPQNDRIRFIPLTKGKVAIVDVEDYEWLSEHKWWTSTKSSGFYACRQENNAKIYMHRIIIKAPQGLFVDHIDRNGLNNRRSNLRLCTISQNIRNRRSKIGTSKYKGVYWDKKCNKWRAAIFLREHTNLGLFDNEVDAAKAYDRKADELFGEFAYLNFPELATKTRRHQDTKNI